MIKENQHLLNQINVLTDGAAVFLLPLAAYWVRFYLLPGTVFSLPYQRAVCEIWRFFEV